MSQIACEIIKCCLFDVCLRVVRMREGTRWKNESGEKNILNLCFLDTSKDFIICNCV